MLREPHPSVLLLSPLSGGRGRGSGPGGQVLSDPVGHLSTAAGRCFPPETCCSAQQLRPADAFVQSGSSFNPGVLQFSRRWEGPRPRAPWALTRAELCRAVPSRAEPLLISRFFYLWLHERSTCHLFTLRVFPSFSGCRFICRDDEQISCVCVCVSLSLTHTLRHDHSSAPTRTITDPDAVLSKCV